MRKPSPHPAATIRSRSIPPIPLTPRKTLARSSRRRRLLLPATLAGRSPWKVSSLSGPSSSSSPGSAARQLLPCCGRHLSEDPHRPLTDLEEKKMGDPEEKEAKKARLIAQLVHAMSTFCWMLGVLGAFYFFVFTVTNFAPLAQQFMPPPAACPTTHLPSTAASPATHLLSRDAHNALSPPGCTPMLAQHIALHSPDKVCALLPTSAIGCTPTLALYIAFYSPGRVCDLLFASTHAIDYPASCASPPTSASRSSDSDRLKSHISGWNRLTLALLLGAVFLVATVKPRVDAAAKAEDRAATEEDKAYDAALDERKKAHDDAKRAKEDVQKAIDGIPPPRVPLPPGALDPRVGQFAMIHSDAVTAREKAVEKAEGKWPLVGVARMGRVEMWLVRILFALSILFSLVAGICSAGAYFRSAELEQGDSMNLGAVIGTMAVPGIPMVLAHVHFFYVAFVEN